MLQAHHRHIVICTRVRGRITAIHIGRIVNILYDEDNVVAA